MEIRLNHSHCLINRQIHKPTNIRLRPYKPCRKHDYLQLYEANKTAILRIWQHHSLAICYCRIMGEWWWCNLL